MREILKSANGERIFFSIESDHYEGQTRLLPLQPLLSPALQYLTLQRRHLVNKRKKCCSDSDQIKYIPSHLGNLRVIPQLGWSFLHLQTAGVDAQESQTSRFCWACESRPGTHCSDPTASHEVQLPFSSAKRHYTRQQGSILQQMFPMCVFKFTVHRLL